MTTVRKNNTKTTEVKKERKVKVMPTENKEVTTKVKETPVGVSKVKKPSVVKETSVSKDLPVKETEVSQDLVTKVRSKKVTSESLEIMFNEFDAYLELEIKNKRSKEELKTLKTVRKTVRNLKLASLKLTKVKPKIVRKVNPDAGFFKPVGISQDLAKFTGWNPKETKTRVDATRYICQYIKEHNLQNPGNRREIVPDKNLSQFLKFDSSKNEPLTYSRLQTYMKPHFIKC